VLTAMAFAASKHGNQRRADPNVRHAARSRPHHATGDGPHISQKN
jgi:hypothetical protein